MTSRRKTTGLALVGAVAVAFGAYSLGSQTGGGSAGASGTPGSGATAAKGTQATHFGRRGGGRFGNDLSGLATKLGVTEDQLRTALQAVRQQLKPDQDRRQRLASELGAALNLPADQVTAALQKVLPARGAPGKGPGPRNGPRNGAAADLAKALGIDASKVRSAFRQLRSQGHRPKLDDLAGALNVDPAKLRSALRSLRADHGRRGHGPLGAAVGADLAKALNVDPATLRAALDKVRAQEQARLTQLRDQFVAALAQQLNLPVDKVKQAVGDLPHHGRHGP
jgi:DNA-binding MarR family transcriptional regulator